MKIVVAASTILEIDPLIESSDLPPYKLIITGVGAMSTIYSLTKLIHEERPHLIIQAGVAGSFIAESLGEVYIVSKDRFADIGVEEKEQWRDVFDMGLTDANHHPYSNGWLVNPNSIIHDLGFPLVDSITINEITTSPSRINSLITKYEPGIESMEGAALHFVCLQENIPFIQLRAVSNYIGERNKTKWEMTRAIKNLNNALVDLLTRIGSKMESA